MVDNQDQSDNPGLLQQAVDAVKQKWDEGGQNIHNALEAANQGNYQPVQDMAVQNAMSTVGSAQATPAALESMGLAQNAPGIAGKVLAKLGIPAGTSAEEALKIVSDAFAAGQLTPAEVQGTTNVLRGVQPVRGYADGGEVAQDSPDQIVQDAQAQAPAAPPTQATPAPSPSPDGVELFDVSGKQPVLGSVPHDQVTEAVASGRFSFPKGVQVPVINPDGQHGSIPAEQAPDAFQAGYRFVTPQDERAEKYGSTGQQAITALEGAAKGVAGPLATLGEVGILGVKPQDIRGREEENPISSAAGETAGFAGSLLTGVGEGALAEKAGQAAVQAAGLGEAASTAAKIGSHAVQAATEMALIQSGHEVGRAIVQDPDLSVNTAITDIGLASLLGGAGGAAFGAVNPLWEATAGPKVAEVLGSFTSKMNGTPGAEVAAADALASKAGVEISPEIKAAMSDDPRLREAASTLAQRDTTKSGAKFQASEKKFYSDISDSMAHALGKDPASSLTGEFSEYQAGNKIGDTLSKEYAEKMEPISKAFEGNKEKYGSAPFTNTSELAENIAKMAQKEAWTGSDDIMSEVNRVLKRLPDLKTVEDLQREMTAVGNNTASKLPYGMQDPRARAGGMLKRLFRDAEADAVGHAIGSEEGVDALNAFQQARKQFAGVAELRDALNDRLKIGGSPTNYSKGIAGMAKTDGEALFRRLNGVGDADVLKLLTEHFPQTAEAVRQAHVDSILAKAARSAKGDMTINPTTLSKALSDMSAKSPELRDFVASAQAKGRIEAAESLLKKFQDATHNFSNTARTEDKLFGGMFQSAIATATMLAGHNPITGAIVGHMTKVLGRDVPDAARLALLKFLGSSAPIEPGAFKTMVDFIHATTKGENLIKSATKNIFKAGAEILPTHAIPSEKDRTKLDKLVQQAAQNPTSMLDIGGKTAHYLPNQGVAMGKTAGTAVEYLSSIKPKNVKQSPLDSDLPLNSVQKASYDRQLDIAQQPLMVLKHLKQGSILPQDVMTLKTLYPALYTKLSNQMMDHVINRTGKDDAIPYQTRIGLSLFLGQAMDSTMTPGAIMGAQPKPQPDQAPAQQAPAKHSTSGLNKLASMYQTPMQKTESRKGQE